jgi:hypothetical protein
MRHPTLALRFFLGSVLILGACGGDGGGSPDAGKNDGGAGKGGSGGTTGTGGRGGAGVAGGSNLGGNVGTGGTGVGGIGSGGRGGAGGTAGLGGAAGVGVGGAAGTSAGGSGGATACTGSTPVALTVKNYQSWCDVSVAGGTASTATAQTVCVASASVVPLSATAASVAFELGTAPWHGTDGDQGSGDPGTVTGTGTAAKSSTTKTVASASACVWICCPFVGGTGCPTTPACP